VGDAVFGEEANWDRVNRVRTFANMADRSLDGDAIADPAATLDPQGNPIAANYRNFRTNPLFAAAGPTVRDVVQQNRADCWLMAPLGAIAQQNPHMIRHLVADAGDGTYLVRLGDNFYRVDADLPTWGAANPTPRNAGLGQQNSLWVAVVEKAYAHFLTAGADHSYRSLDNDNAAGAARAFGLRDVGEVAYGPIHTRDAAGNLVWNGSFQTAAALANRIRDQWLAGRNAVICTDAVVPAGSPLIAGHCWVVTGYITNGAGDVDSILLYNPWGMTQVVTLQQMFDAGGWLTWGTA
jgi:hypothetical protein